MPEGEGLEAVDIGILEGNVFSLGGYTGIAWCAIDLSNLRAAAEGIHYGMLTAASAYHQYSFLHGVNV